MLQLRKLSVAYGLVQAVHEVDLDVGPGEVIALVGANGAGKSSILKCIAGVAPRAGGEISLGGVRIDTMAAHKRTVAGIALSPEGRHVFPEMTVLENLELGAGNAAQATVSERREQMYALFPRLRERATQAAGTLSGGEQQMVAIARALMSGPRVLMLDEPTLGLAPIMVTLIADAVQSLSRQGLAILLSEQNVEMALRVSDRAYVIEQGRLVRQGRSSELAGDPAIQSAYLGL